MEKNPEWWFVGNLINRPGAGHNEAGLIFLIDGSVPVEFQLAKGLKYQPLTYKIISFIINFAQLKK